MVDFFDITYDADWVYVSRAYDHDYRVEGTAKISRHSDEFYTNCSARNQFKKGMIAVKLDVARGKLGQHSNRTVAWH